MSLVNEMKQTTNQISIYIRTHLCLHITKDDWEK